MDERFPEIAEQLLLIERELRVLGWWETTPPGEQALSSQEPFCVDTLEFAQWLQWIFLPRMKIILERDLPLPNASGILEFWKWLKWSIPAIWAKPDRYGRVWPVSIN